MHGAPDVGSGPRAGAVWLLRLRKPASRGNPRQPAEEFGRWILTGMRTSDGMVGQIEDLADADVKLPHSRMEIRLAVWLACAELVPG